MPEHLDLKAIKSDLGDSSDDIETARDTVATSQAIHTTAGIIQVFVCLASIFAILIYVISTVSNHEAVQGIRPRWWSDDVLGEWNPKHPDRNFFHMFYVLWVILSTLAFYIVMFVYLGMLRAIVLARRRFTTLQIAAPALIGFGVVMSLIAYLCPLISLGERFGNEDCAMPPSPYEIECRDGRRIYPFGLVAVTFGAVLYSVALFYLIVAYISFGDTTCVVLRRACVRAMCTE